MKQISTDRKSEKEKDMEVRKLSDTESG